MQTELEQARGRTKAPVLWLLGKSQSGKSSIIQGITGSTQIEIGNGCRPCTRSSTIYDFPGPEDSLFRFLDTRGVGEAFYNPEEDLAYAEKEAHGVLVVMRACDPGQESIKQVLAKVRKRKRSWPVVLVQTTLHEGYPHGAEHPHPYSFDRSPLPGTVPSDLARALDYQHRDFAGLFDRHVAIDFTHPDDGYTPRLYGEGALWAALTEVVPLGYRAVLTGTPEVLSGVRDILFRTAHPHIVSYSTIAGAAGMVPFPAVNIPVVILAQTKMLHSIASVYGMSLAKGLEALGPAIGVSFAGRTFARSLVSGIPALGTALAGLWTASATYGLGRALCWYFAEVKEGAVPTKSQIRAVYAEELARGRERFKDYFHGKRQERSGSPPTAAGSSHAS